MTIMVESLDSVEAWTGAAGQPIPIGEFITEIDNIEEKPAMTGSPQVIVEWRVVEGISAGATSREWLVVLPQTYGKVKSFLAAVGYQIPAGSFEMPTGQLVGRRAMTVWREEAYGGKVSIRCVGHTPVPTATGGGGDIPIDTPEVANASDDDDLPF